MKPTTVVTGASAGLGVEFARQLAAKGYDLVLVARSQDALERLAAELHNAHGADVEIMAVDLATEAGVHKVATRVSDAARPVSVLVNNAGHGLGARFVRNDINAEVAALDLMVKTLMVLSHAAAQAMMAQGKGAILNVSSVASWLGNGTYAAHKAWVTSFTEGLAGELKGTGVTATAVLPGLTRTQFHDRPGVQKFEGVPQAAWLKAPFVVRAALRAMERGKVLVTPSVRYGVGASIARVLPRTLLRPLTRRSSV